jgi:hypothetical protein
MKTVKIKMVINKNKFDEVFKLNEDSKSASDVAVSSEVVVVPGDAGDEGADVSIV